MRPIGLAAWLLATCLQVTPAQTVSPGLTLYQPAWGNDALLINRNGNVVHSWPGTAIPGMCNYMLPNGNLLRTQAIGFGSAGGHGGRIQEVSWQNDVLWTFDYASNGVLQHHDVEPLPNGNVLLIAWETLAASEAVAAGRNPATIVGGEFTADHIVEIQPDGQGSATIVWEWHVMDHLVQDFDPGQANFGVVGDHPELIDINYPPGATTDWNHFNGIDYHPGFDQIAVSSRTLNEIYVIDHSTTVAEAAGHTGGNSGKGGDILYRWGNPLAYDAGTAADQKLFGQHDVQWIEPGYPGAGNFIVFNNGWQRPAGPFSSIEEWIPPVDASGNYAKVPNEAFGPPAAIWTYTASNPFSFYTSVMGGVERLENGNTLIVEANSGYLFEVDSAQETVWQFTNAQPSTFNNGVFKARRYDLCTATTYCTAGISASGCQALLSATGQASASASSGFVVTAGGVEGSKNGQFFYGANGRQALPWRGSTSWRCVTPPTQRAGAQIGQGTVGACDGTFAQDLSAYWQAEPLKNPGAGAQVQLQLWYRDPANTSGLSTSFSDAIEFVVCP